MKPHKKRRKFKTPASLYNAPRTMQDVGRSMVATPRYPDDEQQSEHQTKRLEFNPKPQEHFTFEEKPMAPPTWPATKANTPVPVLPSVAPQLVTTEQPKPVDTTLFPEPVAMKKLSPAELLAMRKRNELAEKEKEKKEKVRYFFTSLKQLRTDLGLTGLEVAKEMGMSDGGYSRIELGYGVSLGLAMKIAEFFGKSVDEIWQIDRENVPSKFEE